MQALAINAATTRLDPMSDIIKSPNDTREYRSLVLANGLKVLLISDECADQAAAAMDIQAGSGHDPEDRHGLAHFLEHMLFLGTEKYPDAGDYQQFINQHGGKYNASTGIASTHYFFKLPALYLQSALDRFSQFFIAPLFDESCIIRERTIVHSEFMARKQDEDSRLTAAQSVLFNPLHPSCQFSAGNEQTLADHDQQPIRADLLAFFRRYYHAQRMALAITSHHSLDQLQVWAEETFRMVAKNGSPYAAFTTPIITANSVPSVLHLKPITALRQATFCFPMESVYPFSELKPCQYLTDLLTHQGQGSLLASLKTRAWATKLSANLSYSDEIQAIFEIRIGLTPTGSDHINEIAALLFSMVRRIQEQGIRAARFDELKQMAKLNFEFKDTADEARLTRQIANGLHHFPAEEVLSAPCLYGDFNANIIGRFAGYLQPNNLQLIITDPKLVAQKTTKWYAVEYAIEAIKAETLRCWCNAGLTSALQLPASNPYLPERLGMMPSAADKHATNRPVKVLDTPGIQVWHQTLLSFAQPKAEFYFALRSPIANTSAQQCVLTRLWVNVLRESMDTKFYSAKCAGLSFQVNQNAHGFSIRISGYSEKQAQLLQEIARMIQALKIDQNNFQFHQQSVSRDLENTANMQPFRIALDGVYDTLLRSKWSAQAQLNALEKLSNKDLALHTQNALSRATFRALSIGNLSQNDSIGMGNMISDLTTKHTSTPRLEEDEVRKLPPAGWSIIHMPAKHSDAAIALVFQGKSKSIQALAATQLLGKLIHPAFFHALRTKAKVGYIVSADALNLLDTPALAFFAQSNRFSVNDMVALIEPFLRGFAQTLFALTEQDFNSSKTGLITSMMQSDKHLGEIASRYWPALERRSYGFDRRERLVAELEVMDKARLCAVYDKLVLDNHAAAILGVCYGDQSAEFTLPILNQATIINPADKAWDSL